MKKKHILSLVLVAAIIFGIILYILAHWNVQYKLFKDIVLRANDIVQEELNFSADGLYPGGHNDYTLEITAKDSGTYGLSFAFTEHSDGGLRAFVNVIFKIGNSVKEYSLDELFNGKTIDYEIEISKKVPILLNVTFIMPEETNSEAMGTETDFSVILTAERILT